MKTKRTVFLAASLGVALLGLAIMGWMAPDPAVAQAGRGGGPGFGPPPGGGPPGPPSLSLAVNDQYIYVLQGPILYQLDAKNLEEINRVVLEIERPPGPPGGEARQ